MSEKKTKIGGIRFTKWELKVLHSLAHNMCKVGKNLKKVSRKIRGK